MSEERTEWLVAKWAPAMQRWMRETGQVQDTMTDRVALLKESLAPNERIVALNCNTALVCKYNKPSFFYHFYQYIPGEGTWVGDQQLADSSDIRAYLANSQTFEPAKHGPVAADQEEVP